MEARVADYSGADNAASSAGPSIALAAQPLETMDPAAVGDIAYATSEWFWVANGSEQPWQYSKVLMSYISKWGGVTCAAELPPFRMAGPNRRTTHAAELGRNFP